MFIQVTKRPINFTEIKHWYLNNYDEMNFYENFIAEMMRNGSNKANAIKRWEQVFGPDRKPMPAPDKIYQVILYLGSVRLLLSFVLVDNQFDFIKINRIVLDTAKYERKMQRKGKKIEFISTDIEIDVAHMLLQEMGIAVSLKPVTKTTDIYWTEFGEDGVVTDRPGDLIYMTSVRASFNTEADEDRYLTPVIAELEKLRDNGQLK